MGEVLQRRFKDLVFRRIELMKGLHRTVASGLLGGAAGALMGATAFLAVNVLTPSAASADTLYRSPIHDNSLYGGDAYRGGGKTYYSVPDDSIHRNSLYDSQLRDREGNMWNCNSLGSCSPR